jgi:hypothetical protein
MRSLQEIFNIAYLGLASQGFEKSIGVNVSCAYRGKGGTKCAIGYLISDEDYDETMEGETVVSKNIRRVIDADVPIITLRDLQRCHDWSDNPENMKANLHDFAKLNSLTIPKETTL